MTPDRQALPYRPCVGIALLNRQGLVFIGRRRTSLEDSSGQGEWQMPQGGIDDGESAKDAAKRELYEETNVTSIEPLSEIGDWLSYDLPPHLASKGWTQRYRGQTQKWFAFRFTGEDSEINIAAPGGHKPEFSAWRWEAMERLPELIVSFKRPIYERVVGDFSQFAR